MVLMASDVAFTCVHLHLFEFIVVLYSLLYFLYQLFIWLPRGTFELYSTKANQSAEQTYLCSLWYFCIDFFIQLLSHGSLKSHWQLISRLDGSLQVSKSMYIYLNSSKSKKNQNTWSEQTAGLTPGKAKVPCLSSQTARYSKTDLSLSRQLKFHLKKSQITSCNPVVAKQSF